MKCIYCQNETAFSCRLEKTDATGSVVKESSVYSVVCYTCGAKSPDCKDESQSIDMYLNMEKRLRINSGTNIDSEAIMFYRNKANKLVNSLNEVKKDFEEYKIITDGLVAQYKQERDESMEYCETLKESIIQLKEQETF